MTRGTTWGTSASHAVIAALLGCASLAGAPTAAQAQATAQDQRVFDIPAGPLAAGLHRYAEITGLQTVYNSELVAGVEAPAVRGRYAPEAALAILLSTSGLQAEQSGRTISLSRSPSASVGDDGSRVLGPVLVEGMQTAYQGPPIRGTGPAQLGGERGRQDEEAIGYRPIVSTAGTGAPTAVEDIPRSISVLTQEQFEKQDIQTLAEALERLPGVTFVPTVSNGGQGVIYVREQPVTTFQVDGGAPLQLDILGNGLVNMDGYERLELVRGPNSVFAGGVSGELRQSQGGSINLVRKRPGLAPLTQYDLSTGSWGRFTAGVDVSRPNIGSMPIGVRTIATFKTQDEFYDNYSRQDGLLQGLVDIPLGSRARLELGSQFSWLDEEGSYVGIPHYSDGPLFPLAREENYAWPDARRQTETVQYFGRLYVDVRPNWTLELGALVQTQNDRQDTANSNAYIGANFNFGMQTRYYDAVRHGDQFALDARLAGKIRTGPFDHNVFLALNQSESLSFGDETQRTYFTTNLDEILPVPAYLRPDAPDANGQVISRSLSRNTGVVIGDVISWRDKVDLSITLRNVAGSLASQSFQPLNTDPFFDTTDRSKSEYSDQWRPNYAIQIRPISNLVLYVSSSDGFAPQDQYYTRSGDVLDPMTFTNVEYGAKYARDLWTASLSYFEIVNTNVAEQIPGSQGECQPTASSFCYSGSGVVDTTTGWDFEVAGEVFAGLSVLANFNQSESIRTNSILPTVRRFPTEQAKIFIDWKPRFLSRASFQLGLRYRSDVDLEGSVTAFDPTDPDNPYKLVPYDFSEPAYLVADFGVDYRLNDRLLARLFVENVADEYYSSTVDPAFNFIGSPRSVMLSLRWRDAGADVIRGPDGLVPFGDAAGWYAAADVGLGDPATIAATGSVNWDHETRPGAVFTGRLGYRFSDNLRFELEGGYRMSDFGAIQGAAGPGGATGICKFTLSGAPFDCEDGDGEVNAWSFMANGLYDFGAPTSRFRPYVGAGAGLVRATVDYGGKLRGIFSDNYADWELYPDLFPGFYLEPPKGSSVDDSTVLGWQLMAGATWQATERVSVDVGYRYLFAPGIEWKMQNSRSSYFPVFEELPQIGTLRGDYRNHAVTVGLRWAFGAR